MIDNLTEAISHERKEAENYTITSNALYEDFYKVSLNCQELANYHEQLALWLEELAEWRKLELICANKGVFVYMKIESEAENGRNN